MAKVNCEQHRNICAAYRESAKLTLSCTFARMSWTEMLSLYVYHSFISLCQTFHGILLYQANDFLRSFVLRHPQLSRSLINSTSPNPQVAGREMFSCHVMVRSYLTYPWH